MPQRAKQPLTSTRGTGVSRTGSPGSTVGPEERFSVAPKHRRLRNMIAKQSLRLILALVAILSLGTMSATPVFRR